MTAKTPVNRATARAKPKHTMKKRCLMRLTSRTLCDIGHDSDLMDNFGMSYLCRCGKGICHSKNTCRTPKNPFFQGFSDFFQHPAQDFSPVFTDFFHKATTREFFRCAIRLFRVSAYLRITFPHSYPHLVDNFCAQPHILSSLVAKSIFTNDISMTQRRHFLDFSCFKLET